MTEVLQEIKDAAGAIAGLDQVERERAVAQLQHLATVQAPNDKVQQAPVRTLGEYLDHKIPEPPALVLPGLVVRGGVTIMTSRGGKGKTTFSLNRMVRWAAGLPVFDGEEAMTPAAPLRSLIIENEGAPGFFQSRLEKIVNNQADEHQAAIRENVLIWGDGGWSSMKLDDSANMDLVHQAAEEHKPDIIFMEPLRGLHKGEENSATEMAVVMDALNGLASVYGLGVMLTHHETKGGPGEGMDEMNAVRGSGTLTDLPGVVERWRHVQGGKLSEIKWTKSRWHHPPPNPVRMRFEPVAWGYGLVAESEQQKAILAILMEAPGERFSVHDMAEISGETQDHCRKVANELVDEKRVKREKGLRSPGESGSPGMRYFYPSDDSDGMAL